ncbi:hypothetical protein L3N51_02336 [Metallosphaera sp. J1]|uniref:hypothetical protein n=1 Tax=Metallosphaera javensis (ex Hofmann et al. 2022) TaxID=99938 RepID=UPI001EE097E6|nr:hypothetical protein [Metallosphaera javensis (ex Hofmann et al. 2022)]MCG3110039.1 hypothetical protein [Metallosphaera javensis (ex Hofmann et al. 2022)]
MNNPITAFILVVVTLILAIGVFTLASFYLGAQAVNAGIAREAENTASGFYIQRTPTIIVSGNKSIAVSLENFNYNGTIYLTAFYFKPSFYGNPSITPQFAIGYSLVNGTPGKMVNGNFYSTSLSNEIYEGSVRIWTTKASSVLNVSFPSRYDGVILLFQQFGNKYVEVGYVWLT